MATRKQYCAVINEAYENHGVYIGTGNGELTESLTIKKIHDMEIAYQGKRTSDADKNTKRDLAFIGKCYENGYDMSKSIACDCSGLETYALRKVGIFKNQDYAARQYQSMSTPVKLDNLIEGDFVFNKTSESTHMATYVGDGQCVESRGRDYGIVRRSVSAGGWVIGGRVDWFEEEYPPLTRNLRYIKDDRMTGEDVRLCKEKLCAKGYLKSKYVDNIFGKHTDKAVRKFQEENGLTVDGIIGQKTYKALMEA